MTDASIIEGVVDAADASARLQLPVGEALLAAGVVAPLENLADLGFGVNHSSQQGVFRRFVAVGEHVCAVQYRKVRFKWFSSHDLDKVSLEKNNRWNVCWKCEVWRLVQTMWWKQTYKKGSRWRTTTMSDRCLARSNF